MTLPFPSEQTGSFAPRAVFQHLSVNKAVFVVIIRSYMMYRPLRCFSTIGPCLFLCGVRSYTVSCLFVRRQLSTGHIQSLILSRRSYAHGFQTNVMGLLADTIAASRKILEDVQYRVRKIECKQKDREHVY